MKLSQTEAGQEVENRVEKAREAHKRELQEVKEVNDRAIAEEHMETAQLMDQERHRLEAI